MKSLCEFMCEATFLEGPYIRTHGAPPKDHKIGSFRFAVDAVSTEDEHVFQSTYTTYKRAKEEALLYFQIYRNIFVLP